MLKSSHIPKKTSFAQTLEPSWVEVMVGMESPLGMVSHTDIVKLVVVGMARVAAMNGGHGAHGDADHSGHGH